MEAATVDAVVRVKRLLPATPQEVFDAWTDPDSLAIWMQPDAVNNTTAELDVCVGGSYRIVMRSPNNEYVRTGEYLEIHPPHRLVFTWRSSDWYENSVVTVDMTPQEDGTLLEVTHERLPDEEAVASYQGGWQSVVDQFEAYLRAS